MNSWVKHPGNKVTATKFFEDHKLPFVDICECLIIMGGPMGVHDEKKFPFLTAEKKFIEAAIKKDKKIIGICLGAQLIADVLGSRVYKNEIKEIGWHEVTFTEDASSNPYFSGFPSKEVVFQWHGDTFDIPSGASKIASSAACENQGFCYNEQVIGLQFHLECTGESIDKLILNCAEELDNGAHVQDRDEMNRGKELFLSRNNALMQTLYSRLTGQVVG